MGRGRQTKYTPARVKKICELLASDTYTVVEICRMVKINPDTYYTWIKEYPDFSESIKKVEEVKNEVLVVEAEKSLMKMVKGYTVQEKKTVTVDSGKKTTDGKPIPKIKEQTTTDKHYQPVPAAVFFTLTNIRPDKWKNRQSNEVTGKDGKDLFGNLTDAELDARIAELEKKLKDESK